MKAPFGFVEISKLELNDYKLVMGIVKRNREKNGHSNYFVSHFKKTDKGIELYTDCGLWLV